MLNIPAGVLNNLQPSLGTPLKEGGGWRGGADADGTVSIATRPRLISSHPGYAAIRSGTD